MQKKYVIVPESVGTYVKNLIKTINNDFNTETMPIQILGLFNLYELRAKNDIVFNEYLKLAPTEDRLKEIETNIEVTCLEQKLADYTEKVNLITAELDKLKGV